jgi:hypothetical protein
VFRQENFDRLQTRQNLTLIHLLDGAESGDEKGAGLETSFQFILLFSNAHFLGIRYPSIKFDN